LLARYYLAVALLDTNEIVASRQALAGVEADLKPEYLALRAECDWHDANLLGRMGKLHEAYAAAQRSLELFERLREEINRTRMQSAVASALARLGRIDEAWQMRCAALRSADHSGDTRTLEVTLNSAVRQAIREREWTIAGALIDAQIARGISSPRLRVDALLWRSFVESRLRGRAADVRLALRAAEDLQDRNLRDDAVMDIRFAEAVSIRTENPRRAVELLNEVLSWRERSGSLDLSAMYVERARAHRLLHDSESAAADLLRAIGILESQRTSIIRDDVRDAFFASAEDAYEELIDLRLDQHDYGGAFLAAERKRARVILDRELGRPAGPSEILNADAVQRTLPRGVTVVHYSVLPQRTLIVTFDSRGWRASTVAVTRAEVERLCENFVGAIARADAARTRDAGRRLYEILMSGVSPHPDEILVVVPDETIAELPFSALMNAQGQYLVEETAITAVPSAAAFVRQAQRSRKFDAAHENALIVGDPAFDQTLFPNLSRLPSAAKETRVLTAALPRSLVLTDAEPTPSRFLKEARRAGIVHIGAHAMTNPRDPAASFLVLALDSTASGLLYHRDIANTRLAATNLVVLAGCRTAAGARAPGSIRSLAMAFIAAGSRNVLGSLWNIDDDDAADLSIRFYRHLLAEPRPAAALRLAQMEMLRSSNHGHPNVRAWSALQMYGTGM
jgi:CHAT domain-containing protein/tetratricopeptide (TPR) repeat protein